MIGLCPSIECTFRYVLYRVTFALELEGDAVYQVLYRCQRILGYM